MNNPKLYTVKEAAKLVGVSTNTLYKYLDEDRIHAARGSAIQGRFRIPESALEEFLGIKLSESEQVTSVPSGSDLDGSAQPRSVNGGEGQTLKEIHATTSSQEIKTNDLQPTTYNLQPSPKLPIKLARFLLIVALLAVLLDLVISHSVSLPGQLSRLLFLFVMLLLAYQEGGYRRG